MRRIGEEHPVPFSLYAGCWLRFGADSAASPRFDLMGLTPDAPEDEAGIKKAAESSKRLWRGGSAELLGASPSLGRVSCFCFLFLSPALWFQPTSPRLQANSFSLWVL